MWRHHSVMLGILFPFLQQANRQGYYYTEWNHNYLPMEKHLQNLLFESMSQYRNSFFCQQMLFVCIYFY